MAAETDLKKLDPDTLSFSKHGEKETFLNVLILSYSFSTIAVLFFLCHNLLFFFPIKLQNSNF